MVRNSNDVNALFQFSQMNPEHVDKKNSTWWFTDDGRLWGDAPYLHLGERIWYEEERLSLERFQIVHLESGKLDEIVLCDQTYTSDEVAQMLKTAGFSDVDVYSEWDKIGLYDEAEWLIYVAKKDG